MNLIIGIPLIYFTRFKDVATRDVRRCFLRGVGFDGAVLL